MNFLRVWGVVLGLCLGAQAVAQNAPPSRKKTAPQPSPPVCLLADFRTLMLATHEPQLRLEAAFQWLTQHARACSIEQLKILNGYRASWLGTADHPKLQGLVDAIVEAHAMNDPQKMQELFAQVAAAPAATESVSVAVKPRAPLAPSPNAAGGYGAMQGYMQPAMPGAYGGMDPMGGQASPYGAGAYPQNPSAPPAPPPPPPPPVR